ncbi:hypothetical protein NEF87_000663 [Candidatus Lokiarchaeum ossiferum]|uniref:Uncharacterized protein n=1 Tax=Candidatus Lokiarchaeum ossiferum TaxID=2951803 RepID=A0ABY6HLJ3_9ARCH|nr:hypothetical protein NEF87_000663 [Candidatus Lokiarchaeum sp. B-35]
MLNPPRKSKGIIYYLLIVPIIVVLTILRLWKYVLYGFLGITILGFFVFLYNRRKDIEFHFISFILGKKSFFFLQKKIITDKFHVIQKGTVNPRILSEINIKSQIYLKSVLRFLNKYDQFLINLPSFVQKLIKDAYADNFSIIKMDKIYQYYSLPTTQLIDNLLNDQNLEENLQERIIYEINYEEILFLEKNLLHNHPILEKIYQQHKIKLNNDFEILT